MLLQLLLTLLTSLSPLASHFHVGQSNLFALANLEFTGRQEIKKELKGAEKRDEERD